MDRREFIVGTTAAAVLSATGADAGIETKAEGLRVRFLGTGAADWNGRDERGECRRLTSLLVDGRVLIDYTPTVDDMLPEGFAPDAILYTHSHGDHYQPFFATKLGVKRVFVHESWVADARASFAKSAEKLGVACPVVTPLAFGAAVELDGVRFTALPANHSTSRAGERTALYLIEKGVTRLIYATDTAGIPADSARAAGIDIHAKGEGITALIMEATMGVDHTDDFRIFTHSSVATVAQTVRVLTETNRYRPAPGQKVYLTHMARTLHGTQKEVEAAVPAPLQPAYDGLEVTFG